ncbi:MAG: class I SAM-dependent methyltransferase, partial [Candidatus Levybacteria bacterium]|nr:class I SAM-dependent methyltransferase [Candidatus Levybacteria bacterium]
IEKLTYKEAATVRYYNSHAFEWSVGRTPSTPTFWQIDLDRFHQLLPSGKVLEIGSGSGREAARLIGFGYDFTGTDIAAGLLRYARKNNPGATFLRKSVYDLDFGSGSFDGFWTAATLLHVPRNRMAQALRNIQAVIKPNGVGFISLKEGKGEAIDEPTGRFFSYYGLGEFGIMLEDMGFRIIEGRRRVQAKIVEAKSIPWITFFVRNISQGKPR